MRHRTMLEQEYFEQFRDQGMEEFTADEMAREWAINSGEYDSLMEHGMSLTCGVGERSIALTGKGGTDD